MSPGKRTNFLELPGVGRRGTLAWKSFEEAKVVALCLAAFWLVSVKLCGLSESGATGAIAAIGTIYTAQLTFTLGIYSFRPNPSAPPWDGRERRGEAAPKED